MAIKNTKFNEGISYLAIFGKDVDDFVTLAELELLLEPYMTEVEITNLVNNINTSSGFITISDVLPLLSHKADLDETGTIPEHQLPSYIDEVKAYASSTVFPTTGLDGVIYVDNTENKSYRWAGTTYVQLDSGLTIGETSATAYRGDRGKVAYDHTMLTNNPHNVSKGQVGLGNVENTSDVDKPISNAMQYALDTKANQLTTYTKSEVDTMLANNTFVSAHGEIYTNNNAVGQLIANGSTPVKMTGFTTHGEVSGTTISHANDNIVVNVAGMYRVSFNMSATTSNTDVSYVFKVFKNGVALPNIEAHQFWITGTSPQNVSTEGSVLLSVGDTIDVRCHHKSGTNKTITPLSMNLGVYKI